MLPHGTQYKSDKSGTNRTLNKNHPQAIGLLNKTAKYLIKCYMDYLH